MEFLFYITLYSVLFIFQTFANFVDFDFFARLIVGKTFFQTGEILKYDFLSYGPTHLWYDHEWGASVIFYFLHNKFGDIGLYLFTSFCLFTTFFFFVQIIKLRRKKLEPTNNKPFNFLYFYIMILALVPFIFSLRCHHFTFLFFAVWLYTLEKSRLEENYKILWLLPFLMIIWSNIHGGCFLALGITGIYAVGGFLSKKRFAPYIYLFLGSFLAMFINPYGVNYVTFLIKATTMARTQIVEWRPSFADSPIEHLVRYRIVFVEFIFLTFYAFYKALKTAKIKEVLSKIDITKFLLLLVMAILSVKSVRFVTYFIFVLIPFCYDDFYKIFSFQIFTPKQNKIKEILICAIMSFALILNILKKDFHFVESPESFPVTEIQYLKDNNVKGNLFISFELGSYAAYKLYPNNFILLDGRYEEVYPVELNDSYVRNITLGGLNSREMFDSIRHDIVICYKSMPMYENMKKHPDFYHVLESSKFSLFIRKDVYKKIKQPAKIPTSDRNIYDNALFDTEINWQK